MKKIKAVVFVLAFAALNSPGFAVNEDSISHTERQACEDSGLCFADDIMKELIKESVETVGKHLLEKAKKKYLNNSSVPESTTTSTQNGSSPSVSTSSASATGVSGDD